MTQCESAACYHCRKSMNFQMELLKARRMFHNVNTIIQCHPRPGGIPVSSLNESSENSLFAAKSFRFPIACQTLIFIAQPSTTNLTSNI